MDLTEGKRFLSEKITMLETSPGADPVRFLWRSEEHAVLKITRQWQDYGFSSGVFKKSWRSRRHRNYYEVHTDRGAHLLVYFDRGVKPSSPRHWFVLEQYEWALGNPESKIVK